MHATLWSLVIAPKSYRSIVSIPSRFSLRLDSRIDLLERQLRHHSSRLKNAATELIPKGLRTPRQLATLLPGDSRRDTLVDGEELDEDEGGEVKKARRYRRDVEREVEKMRLRVSTGEPVVPGHTCHVTQTSGLRNGSKKADAAYFFPSCQSFCTDLGIGNNHIEPWSTLSCSLSVSASFQRRRTNFQLSGKVADFSSRWRSAQIVRTREKICESNKRRVRIPEQGLWGQNCRVPRICRGYRPGTLAGRGESGCPSPGFLRNCWLSQSRCIAFECVKNVR